MKDPHIVNTNAPDWKAAAEHLAKDQVPFKINGFDCDNGFHLDLYEALSKYFRKGEYEGGFSPSERVAFFGRPPLMSPRSVS